jgi:hypothetical protein
MSCGVRVVHVRKAEDGGEADVAGEGEQKEKESGQAPALQRQPRHTDKTRGTVEVGTVQSRPLPPRRNSLSLSPSTASYRHPTQPNLSPHAPGASNNSLARRSNGSGAAALRQSRAIAPLPRRLQVLLVAVAAALIVSDVIVRRRSCRTSRLIDRMGDLGVCGVRRGGDAPMEPHKEMVAPPEEQQRHPPLFLDYSHGDGGNRSISFLVL